MNETDIKDKHGNVIISPGLKVRHKKSQFEYTVDSVAQEPDGKVTVMLTSPEEPRFDPPEEEAVMMDVKRAPVLYEVDPVNKMSDVYYIPTDDEVGEEDLLAVPASEFEKEYEVK
jgi:hypothetical protein